MHIIFARSGPEFFMVNMYVQYTIDNTKWIEKKKQSLMNEVSCKENVFLKSLCKLKKYKLGYTILINVG